MPPIILQLEPEQPGFTITFGTPGANEGRDIQSADDALRAIYLEAKQGLVKGRREPAKKKRRIAEDDAVINEADYVVLSQETLDLATGSANHADLDEETVSVVVGINPVLDAAVIRFELSALVKDSQAKCKFTSHTDHQDRAWRSLRCASIGSVTDIAQVTCDLTPPSPSRRTWQLKVDVKWRKAASPILGLAAYARKPLQACEELFALCVPDGQESQTSRHNQLIWSPKEFYQHVHVPPKPDDGGEEPPVVVPGLTCQLYPFQQRAVRWLLSREGVELTSDGRVSKLNEATSPPISFRHFRTNAGEDVLVSHLLQQVITNTSEAIETSTLKGGVLAEEMGLGKTVELISLISLHRSREHSMTVTDEYTATEVVTANTTLIITPPSILEQWKNELARHAPSLNVLHYTGIKQSDEDGETIRNELLKQDVVITTYSVLASEIHYAQGPPKRSLRQEKKYIVRRSPLVMMRWWRVCLDEAQMIESGVSNAATVARLIPRVHGLAVSGTPLKKDIKDLHGLLIFLRYYPYSDPRVWQRMVTGNPDHLSQLVSQIVMRHSKDAVREELGIPPQHRIVITVPFTAIEESNYSHLFQQMCDDCGVDSDGGPLTDDWNPNLVIEKMRNWLTRLRQTCLHAEIGARNRRALGKGNGPLRTVDEVLEVLIEQNETSLRVEERSALLARIMRGHLLSFGKETQRALDTYLAALSEATGAVEECREQVRDEMQKVKRSGSASVKNEIDNASEEDSDNDIDDARVRLRQYQQRLRSALEVQHICAFFSGTAYFQLKDRLPEDAAESERFQELERKETECYDLAKANRRELLSEVFKRTSHFLDKLAALRKDSFCRVPRVKDDLVLEGIESRKVVDKIAVLSDLLNEQADKINDWRTKFTALLLEKLVDQDEEVEMTGEEYETSTKQQDEQYVMLEALRAAFADRHCLITGQVNPLIDAEMKAAMKLAVDGVPGEPNIKGPAPELFKKILEDRTRFLKEFRVLPQHTNRNTFAAEPPFISVRAIMTEIRSLITAVQWQQGMRSNRAEAEVMILESHLDKLQRVSVAQTKALTALEEELDLFRTTMNQRLEFYKQLQQISDQVAPLQEEMSEEVDMVRLVEQEVIEARHTGKLAALKTKRRFLTHLRAESSGKQEQRICIICQSSFEIGVLTVCGHQYCKECITIWWRQKQTCPMCKRHLKSNEFHEITYKPQELRAQEETTSTSSPSRPISSAAGQQQSSIYTSVAATTLDAIKSIDLLSSSSYGTKIDLICRTLLYLRSHDAGSKSIIFSQYRDFLQVLAAARTSTASGPSNLATVSLSGYSG